VRRYAALSWGHLNEAEQRVDAPLARDPRNRQRVAVVPGGRRAVTDFTRVARFDTAELLRAHLHTGRTHQIRVHLKSIGHPLLGDSTYGWKQSPDLPTPPRVMLHAEHLVFTHPVNGKTLDLRAPLPKDFQALSKGLRKATNS